MTRFRSRHPVLLTVALVVGCGAVEPVFPIDTTTPTTLQTGTGSDGCTPDASDTAASAGGGSADTSGTTGGSEPAPDTCESSSTGSCMPGTEGCACVLGTGCDEGLMCISEICVGMECVIGSEGCPCTQGNGCDPGLVCVGDVCS